MKVQRRIEYNELAKAKVTESRNVVISTCSKGGFTIAQQLVANEGDEDKPTTVFMKGAFHVDDVHGLYNLRDAVNLSIAKAEELANNEDEWDEVSGV